MILAIPLPPTPGQVVIGILAVLVGALVTSVSVFLAVHSGNWLHWVTALGGALIVAGVVGQRTATTGALGAWSAGITVPVVGVTVDVIFAVGVVVACIGTTLVLLFERVPAADGPRRLPAHRRLEDDDAV